MLINSHIFMLLFLPLLLAGWYFLNWKKKFQLAQGYLIGMSLWFYAYANLQYLWLLLFSCLIGWLLSCLPEKIFSEKGKKVLTGVGCVFHLGLLGYFKYSNFFLENLNTVFHTDFPMLQILLPVGISFYTFQQLAYLIDRCRGDAPRDSFFDYLTFMVYFPQLLQGPILLRSEFMGQLKEPERRRFHAERFSEGIQFFVFGLAKKVLLADTLAKAVNYGYSNVSMLDSISALLLAVGYLTELYFDFSGYCDMAVGLGKMIGLEVAENFDAPFHSASVKEFWRRWHMTLGAWFRDYVFYPLSLSKFFSRLGKKCRGIFGNYIGKLIPVLIPQFIIFFLIGIWHGAEWKYIAFGCYNGTLIVLGILFEQPLQKLVKRLAIRTDCISWRIFQVLRTLILVAIGKIITRAPGVSAAKYMITSMVKNWNTDVLLEGGLLTMGLDVKDLWVLFLSCLVLLSVSLMQESGIRVRETLAKQNLYFRWVIYLGALFSLILFGVYGLNYNAADFIYRGF